MKARVAISWSGGKDSALVLDRLLRDGRYEAAALVTTLDAISQDVSAHGVPIDLIQRQADAISLPLVRVPLPERPANDVYIRAYVAALAPLVAQGALALAFGDIFLEDLRRWREESFQPAVTEMMFPLWGEPSQQLADEFFTRGFAAVVCSVNRSVLGENLVGRRYDRAFVNELPPEVDVCGENGEFHTFVFDGPIFREPVRYSSDELHSAGSYKLVHAIESDVSLRNETRPEGLHLP